MPDTTSKQYRILLEIIQLKEKGNYSLPIKSWGEVIIILAQTLTDDWKEYTLPEKVLVTAIYAPLPFFLLKSFW